MIWLQKATTLQTKIILNDEIRYVCVWMYNIVNNSAPFYLTDVLLTRISGSTNYSLRNKENYAIPSYRLNDQTTNSTSTVR